jgi:hypothetical protein
MIHIFLLELSNEKFFVGTTDNLNYSVDDYSEQNEWTTKYIPQKVIQLIPNCEIDELDNYVIRFMQEKGINNVRGGSFVNIILSDQNITKIVKLLIMNTDKCYICGDPKHITRDCKKKDPETKSKSLLASIGWGLFNLFIGSTLDSTFDNEDDNIQQIQEAIINNQLHIDLNKIKSQEKLEEYIKIKRDVLLSDEILNDTQERPIKKNTSIPDIKLVEEPTVDKETNELIDKILEENHINTNEPNKKKKNKKNKNNNKDKNL